jgi:hypothetical protein
MLKKKETTIIPLDNPLMINMSCEMIKIPPEQRQNVFYGKGKNYHFTIVVNSKLSLFCLQF